MSAITGLYVVYNDVPPPPGYQKINIDISKGAGGQYVYLCYSRNENEKPITNIQVFIGSEKQPGYEVIDCDLNKGSGGKYLYVGYSRNPRFKPITEVNILQGSERNIYPTTDDWVRINQDCNEGARGMYSYVVYKK